MQNFKAGVTKKREKYRAKGVEMKTEHKLAWALRAAAVAAMD